MNILVIGSKGFIGSHLINFFSSTNNCYGADVIEDNSENYFQLSKKDPDFMALFSNITFDVCINASGSANVNASISDPQNDFWLNTVNVERMLDAIRLKQNKCMFVLLSSAAVYGNPEILPVKENQRLNPISPYGYHKKMAENLCEYYSSIYGIRSYCLRLFSVYGEGIRKQVMWDITNKFIKEKSVELYGTGEESRDFIHVNDVIKSINLIINNEKNIFNIINIANGEQHKISEIANEVRNVLGSDKEIHFSGNNRSGDPLNWEADISIIENLGYKPSFDFREGLMHYVNWVLAERN